MAGYDAFISYSHSSDDRLAPAIRDGLQKLAKPWNKRRALNIFLDKSSLEISAGLKDSLHAKLEGTQWLILLLSEDSARSQWVGEEIVNWAATKPADRIALVQTDGELYWGEGDWDWERSTAAPRALSGVYAEEPLWLDLRKYRDQADLDIRTNSAFKDDLATLAAPLHGKSKEELVGEDLVQFRKSRRLRRAAVTGLAVLTVLAVTAAYIANVARKEAIKEAKIATTRQVAAQALVESTAQPDLGLLLAVAANDLNQELLADGDIPDALDGPRSALQQILEETPQLVSYLPGSSGRPSAVATAPGSSTLAVGETTGVVSLWDTRTFERSKTFEGLEGEVTGLASSEDGAFLAAGTDRGEVAIWDIGSGRAVEFQVDGSPVGVIAFDPPARRLAVAFRKENDEFVTVRDAASGSRIGDDLSDFSVLSAMAFEGRNRLKVFDHGGLKSCEVGQGCGEGSGGISQRLSGGVAYHMESGLGAAANFSNGSINIYRRDDLLDRNVELGAGIISGMAFSPDGKVLTTVQKGRMSFWNPLNGERAGPDLLGIAAGESTEIVFLSQDGSRLATLANGKVQLWDRGREGRLGDRLPVQTIYYPDAVRYVVGADFSPDGRRAAWIIDPEGNLRSAEKRVSKEGETVAVWSGDTGEIVTLAVEFKRESENNLLLFLDEKQIVTDLGEIWDVEQGRHVGDQDYELACGDSRPTWSASGEDRFARCRAGVKEIKELADLGALGARLENLGVAALSEDFRAVAVLDRPDDWKVSVWMIDDSGEEPHCVIDLGQEVETLNAFGKKASKPTLDLSPRGSLLAVDYPSGGSSFWNTDKCRSLFSTARDSLRAAVFSPDDKLVALDRVDGDIELRETTTMKEVFKLDGEGNTNNRILKFRPDGKALLEAAAGGGMTIWDVDQDSWRQRACALAGRPLDEDERRRFDPSYESSTPSLLDRLTKAGAVTVDPCSSIQIATVASPVSPTEPAATLPVTSDEAPSGDGEVAVVPDSEAAATETPTETPSVALTPDSEVVPEAPAEVDRPALGDPSATPKAPPGVDGRVQEEARQLIAQWIAAAQRGEPAALAAMTAAPFYGLYELLPDPEMVGVWYEARIGDLQQTYNLGQLGIEVRTARVLTVEAFLETRRVRETWGELAEELADQAGMRPGDLVVLPGNRVFIVRRLGAGMKLVGMLN